VSQTPTERPTCGPGRPQPGCQPQSPGPTGPTTPPPGQGQPCNEYGLPLGCDPSLPPEGDKGWWCDKPQNKNHPACREEPGGTEPN
ncbi:MAG: hypothetical protein ACRDNL_09660, partial [Spirillospora sp.]